MLIFNVQLSEISNWTPDMAMEINVLKLTQVISSFFVFILPPLIIPKIFGYDIPGFLKLKTSPNLGYYLLAFIFMVASMPLLNLIIEWNNSIKFPSGIEELMRGMEESNAHITQLMLAGNSVPDLVFNLFVIALIPAIGEEFLFRGLIQKYCFRFFKNHHLAILITAIIFSAIHFQFYGFIPRLLLGMFFGYLVYFSGSLYPAIFAHFANNSMAVIGHFFIGKWGIEEEIETIGSQSSDIWYIVAGTIIAVIIGRFLFRKKETEL
jgi:membrane protease YdiL (CAAX protease family)